MSTEAQIPAELSEEAKNLVCAVFFPGAKAIVKSHPPHAFYTKHEAAFRELLARNLIGSRPYNNYGVVEYRGTDACEEIWREHDRQRFEAQASAIIGKE